MKWVKLQQSGDVPIDRSSHTLTAVGDKLYLFSGEHEARIAVDNDVYRYDPKAGVWGRLKTQGNGPTPRIACTAAAVGSQIWVFAGRDSVEMGEGAFDDLYRLDTDTLTWHKVDAPGVTPPRRSYHTMTAVGTKLYVFGGCGADGRLSDLWAFDTVAGSWAQLAQSDAIVGRGGSKLLASADGATLYVIAGFCGDELEDLHAYNIASNTWRNLGPQAGLPARSVFGAELHSCGAAGCGHAGHVLLFGGEVDPSTCGHAGAGSFSGDLFCYSEGHGWQKTEVGGDVPQARGWFATAVLGGSGGGMVVHGGLDVNNARLGDMYLLQFH